MKCTVAYCVSNSKVKSGLHYFRFPKNPEQLNRWVLFCNRSNINMKNDRVCSLHFKPDDFERNLQFEMGFCKRNRFKLRPGVIPTLVPGSTKVSIEPPKVENTKPVCSYEEQIRAMEMEIEVLRKENRVCKEREVKMTNTIKKLHKEVERFKFFNKNIEEALGRVFTEGQIKKLKNGERKQNWSETDIAHSITLYSTSAKTYKLLKKRNFPLPSVRTLQRWTQKSEVPTDTVEPIVQPSSEPTQMNDIQKHNGKTKSAQPPRPPKLK